MKKTAYIIPGFTQNSNDEEYKRVMKYFKENNFKVIPIRITWKYRVMSDYVNEFLKQYKKEKDEETILFGFSFGAMIALISAAKIKPRTIILASLSPYFKEDLKHVKKTWQKYVGKKRLQDLKKYSFKELASKIKCKTILTMGGKEGKELQRRVREAKKKIKNSELIIIKKATHDISQKEYYEKLKEIIRGL